MKKHDEESLKLQHPSSTFNACNDFMTQNNYYMKLFIFSKYAFVHKNSNFFSKVVFGIFSRMESRPKCMAHRSTAYGQKFSYQSSPYKGLTPLCVACLKGNESKVFHLLDSGTDPNQTNDLSYSPLHYAAISGSTAITNRLLVAGADPNKKNRHGMTPLHRACLPSNPSATIVRLLLEYGAHPNVFDVNGRTPFHHACALAQSSIAMILLDYGADVNLRIRNNDSLSAVMATGATLGFCTDANSQRVPLIKALFSAGALATWYDVRKFEMMLKQQEEHIDNIHDLPQFHCLPVEVVVDLMRVRASQPMTLQELCKLVIRRNMRCRWRISKQIVQLDSYPKILKQYLQLNVADILNETKQTGNNNMNT